MSSRNPDGPVVIVDPFSSGGLFAPAFAQVGVPTVAVLSSAVPAVYASSFQAPDYAKVIDGRGMAPEALAGRLAGLGPRCVLPGTETGVELADLLAAMLTPELANDPDTAQARRHKYAMATAAASAGLPIVRQVCTNDPEVVRDWIDRDGLAASDLVIKPPKSAGTDGVRRIPAGGDWEAAFRAQLGATNFWGIRNDQMLLQEYISGTEFVVDSFSHDGRHTITDVCRYRKVDNGTQMAVYDSMEWLPPDHEVVAELVAYAKGVLDAVGLRFGSAHVEIMLTERGPRLIELNARPHGGGQPRFCRVATGSSQVDRTVSYFTGGPPLPDSYELRTHVMVVFLIASRGGVVGDIADLERLADLPSHHYSQLAIGPGDRIEPTRDLLSTLALGFVVLANDSRSRLLEDYAAIRRTEAGFVASLT